MENKRFQIAVCDDEGAALSIIARSLKQHLKDMNISYDMVCYQDGKELRTHIFQQKGYDILFLDIDMPSLNGIELGDCLRRHQCDSFIVFISNRSDLVFESLRIQPFRFVRKSKFKEEIGIVLKDLMDAFRQKNAKLLVLKKGNTLFKVNPYEIFYVESQRKIQWIHLSDRCLEAADSFSHILEELKEYGFLQIHRCYLVNVRFIASINKNDLELDNGEILPISRQRTKEVRQLFQKMSLEF